MKVKKLVNVKKRYHFEAPVLPAAIKKNKSIKASDDSEPVDLNSLLAPRPDKVYLVRVTGESMINENILDGDILVVDKTEYPKDGSIVIASLNGEMAVKTYRIIEGKVYLFSANEKFLPIEIFPFWHFEVQGVVKHVIHPV